MRSCTMEILTFWGLPHLVSHNLLNFCAQAAALTSYRSSMKFKGMCLDVTGNSVLLQGRQSRARRQGRRGKALGLGTTR